MRAMEIRKFTTFLVHGNGFMGPYLILVFGMLAICSAQAQGDGISNERGACFGETIELMCADGKKIEIESARNKLLKKSDTICGRVNITATGSLCQEIDVSQQIQKHCDGGKRCSVTPDEWSDLSKECQPSMYLAVSFQCNTVNNPNIISTVNPTAGPVTDGATTISITSDSEAELSVPMRLIILFIDIQSAGKFIVANPRKSILCIILSLAFGISLLIVFMLIVACYKRFRVTPPDSSSDVAKDEADGVKQLLLSKPVSTLPRDAVQPTTYETVLVTRQNGVPLQETTISSDSTLLTRRNKNNHAEVISTIKRTHSIDEGTQTDNEDFDRPVVPQPRTLSIQEVQELGDLVNDMNCYNSRIDDDDAFYPHVSGSFSNSVNNNNNNTDHLYNSRNTDPRQKYRQQQDRYHYANRGPSFADGGRASPMTDRQPLMSRNNSGPVPPSPYHLRNPNQDFHKKRNLSRNPSELSYNTSASESSLGNYSPDAIFNGDNLRHPSIQRTPKPGVRGDGFEFIVNSTTRSGNR